MYILVNIVDKFEKKDVYIQMAFQTNLNFPLKICDPILFSDGSTGDSGDLDDPPSDFGQF